MSFQFEKVGRSITLIEKAYSALLKVIGETSPNHNKLPSEEDIACMLGVSRTTIREALNQLVSEGLISKVPGKGYYAHRSVHDLKNRIDLYPDFYKLLTCYYREAVLTIANIEKRSASPKTEIEFKKNDIKIREVYAMRWIYSANGTRMFVGDLEFPVEYIVKPFRDLNHIKGLSDFSDQYMRFPITHCTMTLDICTCVESSQALGLGDQIKPALCWFESIYNLNDEIIGCGRYFINPDSMKLSINAAILK